MQREHDIFLVLRNVETSKVAGYRCCFIQDDGKGGLCGLKMAFRIDPNLRGQGLGKLMDQLMTEDLKRLYPEVLVNETTQHISI